MPKHWLLIIEIVVPMVVVFGFLILFSYMKLIKKEWTLNDKGTVLLEINTRKRKIKINNPGDQKILIPNLMGIKKMYSGGWFNFDNFINNFSESTKKEFRNIIFNLENESDLKENLSMKLSTDIKISKKKKRKTSMNIEITRNNIGDNLFAKLTWRSKSKEVKKSIPRIEKDDFKKYWFNYSSFFYFGLNELINPRIEQEVMSMMRKIFKSKNAKYFILRGAIIIVDFNNSQSKLRKNSKKRKERIFKRYTKSGLISTINGCSILLRERTTTIKDVDSALIRLRYAALFSNKDNNKPTYFTHKMNDGNFKKYKEASGLFYQHIRGNMIDSESCPIKKYGGKRKIMDFLKPVINNMDQEIMKKITNNKYNQKILIDAHANNVILNLKDNKPLLIDINDDWLLENHKSLYSKNIIYLVNINSYEYEDQLVEVIKELAARDIHVGIRITNFMHHLFSMILSIKPKILVIDKVIAKDIGNEKTFLLMVSTRKMADSIGCKLIYENPDQKLDEDQIKTIKLKLIY